MTEPTVEKLAQATRLTALTIASDPKVRHYSSDTIALVVKRTILAYVGAGSWEAGAEKLASDPELADVPLEAVVAISGATLIHFARAMEGNNDG